MTFIKDDHTSSIKQKTKRKKLVTEKFLITILRKHFVTLHGKNKTKTTKTINHEDTREIIKNGIQTLLSNNKNF